MKKIICCFIMAIMVHKGLIAQNPPIQTVVIPPAKPVAVATTIRLTDIELFERPGFMGRNGFFTTGSDGKLTPPFALKNISFKVPAGKIVYIRMCDLDFPSEVAYTQSQKNIDLTNICGIRSDDAVEFTIQFNGISTIIHNNDCKRFFGSLKIKVSETSPDASHLIVQSVCQTSPSFRGPDMFTFLPYKNANANTSPVITNYVFDANPAVPVISSIASGSSAGSAIATFKTGRSALRDGRVSIAVISDLGSAHKTCDVCDDFSSNVRMATPVTESIPLNRTYSGDKIVDAAHSKLVLGPYLAHGSRDGSAITATGGTNIDIRVHLTVTGL